MNDELPTDRDLLKRIDGRMDQMFQAMIDMTAILEDQSERLAALHEWANEPPSTDLQKFLEGVATTLAGLQEAVEAVPDQVAAAVRDR